VHAPDRDLGGGPPDHRTDRGTRGLGRRARGQVRSVHSFTERTGCDTQTEVSRRRWVTDGNRESHALRGPGRGLGGSHDARPGQPGQRGPAGPGRVPRVPRARARPVLESRPAKIMGQNGRRLAKQAVIRTARSARTLSAIRP
jgi:hypothetical protein